MTQQLEFNPGYQQLLELILTNGRPHQNTISMPGIYIPLPGDMQPILTLRKVHYAGAIQELCWILNGETNVAGLGKYAKYWAAQADENGEVPQAYGSFFRGYQGGDQLINFLQDLIAYPESRRHFISLADPGHARKPGMPPCLSKLVMNCYKTEDGYDCSFGINMRSSDLMLGFVFDIFQYWVWAQVVCKWATRYSGTTYKLLDYYFQADNMHIYTAHLGFAHKLLKADPQPPGKVVFLTDKPNLVSLFPEDLRVSAPESGPYLQIPLITKNTEVSTDS